MLKDCLTQRCVGLEEGSDEYINCILSNTPECFNNVNKKYNKLIHLIEKFYLFTLISQELFPAIF